MLMSLKVALVVTRTLTRPGAHISSQMSSLSLSVFWLIIPAGDTGATSR